MSAEPPVWIRDLLSPPRLTPYLRAVDGSAEAGIRLYWWNSAVSAAFYGPLHCLEIGLRNALHDTLRRRYARPDWWTLTQLKPHGARKVKEACEKLAGSAGSQFGPDDVVATLTFGFWVALLSRGYDRTLWVPTLHRAFPHYRGSRRELHDSLEAMLLLRNRVMHYEPIHHRDLAADRAKIYRLLGYLSPEAAREIEPLDRIPELLSRREGIHSNAYLPRF